LQYGGTAAARHWDVSSNALAVSGAAAAAVAARRRAGRRVRATVGEREEREPRSFLPLHKVDRGYVYDGNLEGEVARSFPMSFPTLGTFPMSFLPTSPPPSSNLRRQGLRRV